MECLNKLLKKFKSGVIIALMLMMCTTTMPSFATEPTTEEPPASTGEETEVTNLPHIDMKVKQVKVGDTNQVLVECWASKLNNLEGIDIVFTYDKTVLQPSYINGDSTNEILEGIDTIKWETRPDVIDPSTHLSIEEEEDFRRRNLNLLSKSFEFKNGYENDLEIFAFQYLATNENNEAVKFVTQKKTNTEITTEEEVLLGAFSFRKISDASFEGTFSTKYIGITSDNNEDGFEIRDTEYGENCEELVEFIYEKYGSITGTIKTILPKTETTMYATKNIATIKIYKRESVATVDWSLTTTAYLSVRNNLPDPEYQYSTTEEDNGKFLIDKINFGEYVILVDKNLYADYIITDVILSSENKDINLDEIIGDIEIIAGDIDKNGKITAADRNKIVTAYDQKPKDDSYDLTDDGLLRAIDKSGFLNIYNPYRNKVVKKVVSISNS